MLPHISPDPHRLTIALCRDLYQHSHIATTAPAEFAPSAAILGGLLAQDILRALSRKEKPVMGLCVVDCMAGAGAVSRWGVTERDS